MKKKIINIFGETTPKKEKQPKFKANSTATGLWNTETTKQLMSLTQDCFILTRKLLRGQVKADWRKYYGTQFDMKCLRFSHYDSRYKYKLSVLNRCKQHIRIDLKCDSRLFIIQYDGNYISQGMQEIVYIQTIPKHKIIQQFNNNHESSTFIICSGINRRGQVVWSCNIPIYYKILRVYPNDDQQLYLQKRFILPKCVTPLQF